MTELLGKDVPFQWGERQEDSFSELQKRLIETPILAYPNPDDPFIIYTNASDCSIGAVLSQVQEGIERVVAYASLRLVAVLLTQRELLVVVKFTHQFQHYLLGWKFLLCTDHSSLAWLFWFRAPEGQMAHWLEQMSQYDFVIEHRSGRQHSNADGMSRSDLDNLACDCSLAGQTPARLPCNGCPHCVKLTEKRTKFAEYVDDVVPLAV